MAEDGRMAHFGENVTFTNYERADRWVHHGRFDDFVGDVKEFVA